MPAHPPAEDVGEVLHMLLRLRRIVRPAQWVDAGDEVYRE